MKRSDDVDASVVSEPGTGECVRGHLGRGSHWSACPDFGKPEAEATCTGCAPALHAEGVLLCDRCYRRLRFLLHSASDLLGRMRTLAQQGKAVVYQAARGSSGSAVAPDQVEADLVEATLVLTRKLEGWGGWIRSGRTVLDQAVADPDLVRDLSADVLDVHPELAMPADEAEELGLSVSAELWSLADAHARWGVERRDRYVYPAEDEPGVVIVSPVHEWYDPLLEAKDAAARAGITEGQLRRWVKAGVIEPSARLREAGALRTTSGRRAPGRFVSWFYASQVDAAADLMRERREAGRFGAAPADTVGSA